MAIHTLRKTRRIRATVEQCWAFFSDPRNLARITPPALDFKVLSDLPERIYPGLMIECRVRLLRGFAMTWVTEITHMDAPRFFVDEQRIGPYRLWHHEHFFTAMDERHVEVCDLVHYAPPFGWIGELAAGALVDRQLRAIFDFRDKAMAEIFPD